MSEIEDRRQRAREAAHDAEDGPLMDGVRALDIAIETATQVKITDEILKVLPIGRSDALDIIEDLFTAAGFEVIE